jgi:beta-galactosidase
MKTKNQPEAACIALAWLALAACLTAGPLVTAARTVIDFDSNWRFQLGDFANAAIPAFDDGSWRSLNVPHDWSNEGPFESRFSSGTGYAPGGIGWYRKHFTVDPSHKGKMVAVEFDGIYDHAQVWINGQYAGGRPYGYSSFQIDLSRYLDFGGDNVIAVRVDHSRYADSRWYTGSGIYRHVRLSVTDRLHVGPWGVFVTAPEITGRSARVKVETDIVNAYGMPRDFSLSSEVIDASGRTAAVRTDTFSIDGMQNRIVLQEMTVASPRRWSLESPHLYTLHSRILSDGAAVDETSTPFGIRRLAFDAEKGFFLNGEPVKLKGVCIHHDAGSVGSAVPDKVLERRLRLLKELGVNAIRTSHNPPAPELLDLCDRLGLLVKDEAFDEFCPPKNKWVQGWNVGFPGKFGYGESFEEWSIRDIEDLVRRDRNHPSVIMWSIGNEIDYPNDPFSHPVLKDNYRPQNPPAENLAVYAAPLIAAVKRLDPTRPVTAGLASVEMSDAVGLGEMLDVVGYNYQEPRYPADHRKFPNRFLFGSETGHRYGAWTVVRDTSYVAAQFLWTGIDYLGEAYAWPNRGQSFGLLDLCGFKKPAAWFRQSLWSSEPMVYLCATDLIQPSQAVDNTRIYGSGMEERWNWPRGASIALACFTNCPFVLLKLNGRAVGEKPLSEAVEGVLKWTIPYEPGELKVVGLKNGKQVALFALQTAGPASRIELIPDSKQISADGKDICHVEYRIVDARGVRVPAGDRMVSFEVEGPADLIGAGNGDLNNTESTLDPMHQTFQGRGLVILQSKKEAGKITLKATAAGLQPAVLQINNRRDG